jgi:hypothetical protein
MNILEARGIAGVVVEAASAVVQTTIASAPSMAIAIVLARTTIPPHLEVCIAIRQVLHVTCFFIGTLSRHSFTSTMLTSTGNRDAKPASFHLDRDDIKNDLTTQRPIYPLSCYGPGREAPRQLIEGPVEISPEELRLRYYTLRTEGNEPTAVCINQMFLSCLS